MVAMWPVFFLFYGIIKTNNLPSKRNLIIILILASFVSLITSACKDADKEAGVRKEATRFRLLSPEKTNITFGNYLTEGVNTNLLMYEYFYNGGGVSVGDINGDDLQDIYFTGNMVDNRLYLNKGNMQFEDITEAAGVTGRPGPWKTGVTMADVNGDGKTDMYVCYSGKLPGVKRVNQLFINQGQDNNGITRFSEEAQAYGLADSAYSTHAVFFDMDHDSDLDMFLLNHNPNSLPVLDESRTRELIKKESPQHGMRLYKNDRNKFQDVTKKAGLSSTVLSYGLGAGVADINNDGWMDIYVCNDYTVPDYLYINNRNGTFTNSLQSLLGHTSHFSMGNDIADVNNDGLPDIYTLDMLPEDNRRQKLLFAPDNYEKFDLNLKTGFYYQYMRNMLHLNNGDGSFSEIGQLAGISNTDWSWAPLFADYDNDGWKDLFVSNGFTRDYTNMDFIKYMNDYISHSNEGIKRQNVLDLVRQMPSSNVRNYIYRNNGNLQFADVTTDWGLDSLSVSNGAAYADLDNDGDLDLVINNINQTAFVYENAAGKGDNHYLQVKLVGEGWNTQGIGTKAWLYANGNRQYLQQMPARGYQSSVSPVLHFGTGNAGTVDSLLVKWPSGKTQVLKNIKTNQLVTITEKDAHVDRSVERQPLPAFQEISSPVSYQHPPSEVNDFKRQPLLVNPLSFSGPCMVKGDVNADGREDIYIGASGGVAAKLFIQQQSGKFTAVSQPAFEADKLYEDADAVFLDADGDGNQDIYVASGGYHNFEPADARLQDRLYLGDRTGKFKKAEAALPEMLVSKSCARVTDVNGDGFPDVFVGGRCIPGRYPEIPESYLLVNDGKGRFTNQLGSIAPALRNAGMITDAAWADMNGDKKNDLVVVGEWMPVSIYINNNGKLQNSTEKFFSKSYNGWWNRLFVSDMNNDGKPDIVAGNLGLNTQCRANEKEPAELVYKDFDDNGAIDPIFCFYVQGKSYPYVTRDELLDQMSIMRTRFQDYKSYADATLTDIFTEEELKGANRLTANYFKTAYFESGGDGKLQEKPLPLQAQFSPVFTITSFDFNNDNHKDLLLCGNINEARLRFGKYDANYGVLLQGDGKGGFKYVNQQSSGLKLKGDVRSVIEVNGQLLFGINQQPVKAYKVRR
jgi:enediyne biosynthesis protein E4